MTTQRLVVIKLSRSLNRTVRWLNALDGKSVWPLMDAKRLPPLIAGINRCSTVTGVVQSVLRVQEHMLAYLDGTLPWCPLAACKALQHLLSDTDFTWSPVVLRFAAALRFELPREAHDGRVTLREVDCIAQQFSIVRIMKNPRIAWEPRPSMPGWQQGRIDGVVVVYLDVGEKRANLRWSDRDPGEAGWSTKHGSEGAAKLAAERRVGADDGIVAQVRAKARRTR